MARVTAVERRRALAQQLRVDSVRMSAAAKSGHPTSAMSAADLMAVLVDGYLALRLLRAEEPRERPPRLLERPRVDAPLRDLPRRRRRLRRGHPRVPDARQHARGPSDTRHPVGRRRNGLARSGTSDRRRDGACREAPRAPAEPRVGALRRQRDGRGLDVGGVRARRALRARQPHGDHRRQPARPAWRDDGRVGSRHVRRARGGIRVERDRARRPRPRRDRRRARSGRRDDGKAHGSRRAHDEGKGRRGGGESRTATTASRSTIRMRPSPSSAASRTFASRSRSPKRPFPSGRPPARSSSRGTSSAPRSRRARPTVTRSLRSARRAPTWSSSTARSRTRRSPRPSRRRTPSATSRCTSPSSSWSPPLSASRPWAGGRSRRRSPPSFRVRTTSCAWRRSAVRRSRSAARTRACRSARTARRRWRSRTSHRYVRSTDRPCSTPVTRTRRRSSSRRWPIRTGSRTSARSGRRRPCSTRRTRSSRSAAVASCARATTTTLR